MSDLNNTNFSEMSSFYPVTGEVVEDPLFDDVTPWDMSEEMVEVDQTPLQDQIQKNKECKYLQSDLQFNYERFNFPSNSLYHPPYHNPHLIILYDGKSEDPMNKLCLLTFMKF